MFACFTFASLVLNLIYSRKLIILYETFIVNVTGGYLSGAPQRLAH